MRLARGSFAVAAMSAALAFAAVSPAAAIDGWGHDRVYADSFGNLVIESAAGYKRILVGEGDQAARLSQYVTAGQPTVAVVDAETTGEIDAPDCYRPPYLVKGRSYMYGFDQGEIPWHGGPCR